MFFFSPKCSLYFLSEKKNKMSSEDEPSRSLQMKMDVKLKLNDRNLSQTSTEIPIESRASIQSQQSQQDDFAIFSELLLLCSSKDGQSLSWKEIAR